MTRCKLCVYSILELGAVANKKFTINQEYVHKNIITDEEDSLENPLINEEQLHN
jgi:hypothetical protein